MQGRWGEEEEEEEEEGGVPSHPPRPQVSGEEEEKEEQLPFLFFFFPPKVTKVSFFSSSSSFPRGKKGSFLLPSPLQTVFSSVRQKFMGWVAPSLFLMLHPRRVFAFIFRRGKKKEKKKKKTVFERRRRNSSALLASPPPPPPLPQIALRAQVGLFSSSSFLLFLLRTLYLYTYVRT